MGFSMTRLASALNLAAHPTSAAAMANVIAEDQAIETRKTIRESAARSVTYDQLSYNAGFEAGFEAGRRSRSA